MIGSRSLGGSGGGVGLTVEPSGVLPLGPGEWPLQALWVQEHLPPEGQGFRCFSSPHSPSPDARLLAVPGSHSHRLLPACPPTDQEPGCSEKG